MTLIKSISGIRGTIGGSTGDNLTPIDIVECTAGFAMFLKSLDQESKAIVIGRDGRISGSRVSALVSHTLQMMGYDVINLGLSTTPTVEIAVPLEQAAGGIVITASHNEKQWNALKFLNAKGEFISQQDAALLLNHINNRQIQAAYIDELGKEVSKDNYFNKHIEQILAIPYLDVDLIRSKRYTVVVDSINSTGALILPILLERLGATVININDEVNGQFAHNPEPLPENLIQLSEAVRQHGADLGICVDPDVDRLAFVDEKGQPIGEEYTLVMIADFVLAKNPGPTVSNLSSSRALADITQSAGCEYFASAVGEVHVVNMMKSKQAVIGGEGNGGVILPELHYGRDAVAGVALALGLLAERDKSLSSIRASYPDYNIVKQKIELTPTIDYNIILDTISQHFNEERLNNIDGLKIDFHDSWVHLRKSNTEPIIRVYAEAADQSTAFEKIDLVKKSIAHLL